MAQTINLGRVVGPNEVSTETTTPLDGILVGDGATVNAIPTPLPVKMGGTGAADNVTALRNLGARSNPNLLKNWDFRNPVNQRGQKKYTGLGIIINSWSHSHTAMQLTKIVPKGIQVGFSPSLTITAAADIQQSVKTNLSEKDITISAAISDVHSQNAGVWLQYLDETGGLIKNEPLQKALTAGIIAYTTTTPQNTGVINVILRGADTRAGDTEENYAVISAVKLELGSVSTLALDLDQPSEFRVQALKLTGRTGGMDLSRVMTAAELHGQITAGDYSNIHMGDYWPITLNGSFKDYATGETKTFSNAVVNLEFMPNFYATHGDTAIGNHCLVCSRDCLPIALQMRSANDTWFDESQTNPFLGSHLYQTLNAPDGIIALVEQTELGQYIGNMRFRWERKPKGATTATSWAWGDRGKLFLPTEREVWGQDVWSEHGFGGGGAALQWSIFTGSYQHIIKRLGDGGARCHYWNASSVANSEVEFCDITDSGFANAHVATTALAVPLCWIIV